MTQKCIILIFLASSLFETFGEDVSYNGNEHKKKDIELIFYAFV